MVTTALKQKVKIIGRCRHLTQEACYHNECVVVKEFSDGDVLIENEVGYVRKVTLVELKEYGAI